MRRHVFDARSRNVVLGIATMLLATAPSLGYGVVLDFEQPTYLAAPLVTQDGWVTNDYIGGSSNGTVLVSTVGPLSGAQSLSYEQTSTAFGSDISKPQTISVTGGAGVDLNVSFLVSGTGNSTSAFPEVGLFLSHEAFFGASPLFVRLLDADLQVGSPAGFVAVPGFSYTHGDTLKFTLDVDLDASVYQLTVHNQTAGGVQAYSGLHAFEYGLPAEGPGGEYLVDVGLALRKGSVKIDDLTLTAVPEPASMTMLLVGLGSVYALRSAQRRHGRVRS